MPVRIPETHKEGLTLLFRLPQDQFEQLDAALQSTRPTIAPDTLASSVAAEASSIQPEEAKKILRALISLSALKSHLDVSVSELVDDINEGIDEKIEALFTANESERADFTSRLNALLQSKSLTVTAKGPDVWFEHSHAFCSARIMTDIRSVFGQPEDLPLAAGIVHTLKITYHVDDGMKDFYVALDEGDVRTLRELLDRAELKFASLQALLDRAKVPLLESE